MYRARILEGQRSCDPAEDDTVTQGTSTFPPVPKSNYAIPMQFQVTIGRQDPIFREIIRSIGFNPRQGESERGGTQPRMSRFN